MSKYKERSRKIARDRYWKENDRESYRCPDCGRTEDDLRNGFEVHHKSGSPMDNRPENLVALCRPCHNIREGKKPSLEDIKHLRDNQQQKTKTNNVTSCAEIENTLFMAIKQVERNISSLTSNPLTRNEHPPRRLSDHLRYESEESMLSVKPKNRREAALFRKGRIEARTNLYNKTESLEKLTDSIGYCTACGAEQADSNDLLVFPSATDLEFEERTVLCGDCSNEVLGDFVNPGPVMNEELARAAKSKGSSEGVAPSCQNCGGDRADDKAWVSRGEESKIPVCTECSAEMFFEDLYGGKS